MNLKEILSIQTTSYDQGRMVEYITSFLGQCNISYYIDEGNIYATKGEGLTGFPCVVAHMDTVHGIVEDLTVVDIAGNLTGFNAVKMEQTGVGGDDKVGVYIALSCLLKFDNLKVAFFRDEEVGCEGSYLADTEFFRDVFYVLQCDRRGNKDFICNASGVNLASKKFRKAVKPFLVSHGFEFNYGYMTDVLALKELGVNCSMCNIACGYYNPHSSKEYVNVKDVNNTLSLVCAIIENIKTFYPHNYSKPVYSYAKNRRSYGWDQDTFYHTKNHKTASKAACDCCSEYGWLTYSRTYNIDMCNKCLKAYDSEPVGW